MNHKLPFSGGVDLPPGLPELSEWESISINLRLPFPGVVDLPCGLPELSE